MAQAKLDSGPAEARGSTGQRGREFGAGRHREEERKEGDGADGVGRSVSGRVRKGKRGWVAPTCGPERGEGVSEEWLAGGSGGETWPREGRGTAALRRQVGHTGQRARANAG